MRERGFIAKDLCDNELVKVHLRHLAGGRNISGYADGDGTFHEKLFRFEFPEAPGALYRFFDAVNFADHGWNISLFHYRNHGHDFGRVLVGVCIKPEDISLFQSFLDKLGHRYYDETENEAYIQFIR